MRNRALPRSSTCKCDKWCWLFHTITTDWSLLTRWGTHSIGPWQMDNRVGVRRENWLCITHAYRPISRHKMDVVKSPREQESGYVSSLPANSRRTIRNFQRAYICRSTFLCRVLYCNLSFQTSVVV